MTIQPAPDLFLNLRFGTWYRPRQSGAFDAVMCVEPHPNIFHIVASREDGRGQNVVAVAREAAEALHVFTRCLGFE